VKDLRCMISKHNEVKVGIEINIVPYLRIKLSEVDLHSSTTLSRLFFDMYNEELYDGKSYTVQDLVCIRCDKCFDIVNNFKKHAASEIKKLKSKIEKERIQLRIAEDIYKEKCRNAPK